MFYIILIVLLFMCFSRPGSIYSRANRIAPHSNTSIMEPTSFDIISHTTKLIPKFRSEETHLTLRLHDKVWYVFNELCLLLKSDKADDIRMLVQMTGDTFECRIPMMRAQDFDVEQIWRYLEGPVAEDTTGTMKVRCFSTDVPKDMKNRSDFKGSFKFTSPKMGQSASSMSL